MGKYARALRLHELTQEEYGRETFKERVSQWQEPQPATEQEFTKSAADTNGRILPRAPEFSWLFHLAPALREGYLRLNRNLLLSSNGKELKTLVLTSPEEQDERSFVAAEFAAFLATDLGRKVLLVDGDVDRSFLSRLFGRAKHLGLREILISGHGVSGTPIDLRCPGLVFLPNGIEKQELVFLPSAFKEWERQMRDSFDYVLIDTPPLSRTADGALLGKLTDGVILVAQAERTDRALLATTREQMEKAQSRVLGVVLTHTKDYIPYFLRRYVGSAT
jgi:capsular exopolysaccharide synthesis family protein